MTNKLLRLPAVLERTGLSRSAVYEGMANGEFPKQVRLWERAKARGVAWAEDEIQSWIDERVTESRSSQSHS